MKIDIDALPNDPAELKRLLIKQSQRLAFLEEQFRLAQQKRFGASSEAFPGQGELFNEAEEIALPAETAAAQETLTPPRRKPTRNPLPKDLPRETVFHDIAEEEKQCACCGGRLHQMGADRSEKLLFIPAQIRVVEHVRPKYACRECEKSGIQTPVKQASLPAMPIKKGMATSSLLSQLITSKYQYGLPLYRQESVFKQYGIDLSRQTQSDWILKSAQLFTPLVARFREMLLQQPVLHADETPVKVVTSEKTTHYMWVYCVGTDTPEPAALTPNIVLYDHQASRSGTCAADYLAGFQGYLQVDGYQGYEQTGARLVGCMAHARRKFMEAKQAQGKNKTGKADIALSLIQSLYRVEHQVKGLSPAEKYRIRQEKALPIWDKLSAWLVKTRSQVIPKSKLGEAVTYLSNQWAKLIRYREDGRLSIDNNRAERAIKPFVIGRKAWLFSHTSRGAQASAILYSVIETAKANGLIPFDYVMTCLDELCQPTPDLEKLLPWKKVISKV
ncbi:putative transposase [Xenorhabdus bovienii SS-2004]|uniref:Putative transposase n=3 Tax=Xenorhabdus bovienii TaxID=40576 RepID=D3V0N6_XENBS|nr:IS66 family transposase [Xenorhabdus bovienii]CBJ80685.1 putative transposase [Xenorhabdus bovienii SS-2004]